MNIHKRFALILVPTCLAVILTVSLSVLAILHVSYTGNALSDKRYLLESDPVMIFAGDSRAHRQLAPFVAAPLLGLPKDDVVNIAITGGNITDLAEVVAKQPEKFRDATVLISMSILAMNDGVLDGTSITDSIMSRMSLFEQVYHMLPEHSSTFMRYYRGILKTLFGKKKQRRAQEDSNGYLAIDKMFTFTDKWVEGMNSYWFNDWNVHGFKHRIMEEELRFIKQSVGKVYVFTGPYAPSVVKGFHESDLGIEAKKLEFDEAMKDICKELDIPYITYYGDLTFKDGDYYDGLHLNSNATGEFTRSVLSDFNLF